MTNPKSIEATPIVDGEGTAEPRKAYERPRILYRESLEALAISCTAPGGKGDPINCPVFAAS